jgi:metal-responsive CopG/Arc/MetJ family transcriptional regulator
MSAQDDRKQQFNIYLPADLVRKVKHAAVDAGQSLSRFVEDALRTHIAAMQTEADSDRDDTERS